MCHLSYGSFFYTFPNELSRSELTNVQWLLNAFESKTSQILNPKQ